MQPEPNSLFEAYVLEKLGGLEKIEKKVDRIEGIENKIDGIEEKLEGAVSRIEGVENKIGRMEGKIGGIESKLDEVIEKLLVHDTQFEAIFYCFGKHDERLENLENQGADLLKEMRRLRADNKVSDAYYNAVVQRIERLEHTLVV